MKRRQKPKYKKLCSFVKGLYNNVGLEKFNHKNTLLTELPQTKLPYYNPSQKRKNIPLLNQIND